MGVIKPPWVSKKDFKRTPFNYCDHFGDEEELVKICKVCREGKDDREAALAKGGKPFTFEHAFKSVEESLGKELGINPDELEEIDESSVPETENFALYRLAFDYSNRVSSLLEQLEVLPLEADTKLASLTVESLAHSRHYILAKLNRALRGKWETENDDDEFSKEDSKTSALLAFLAIRRNETTLKALSLHKPLLHLQQEAMELTLFSIDLANIIHEELIEEKVLAFSEAGCDTFNHYFANIQDLDERFFQEVVGLNRIKDPQKQLHIKLRVDKKLQRSIGEKEMNMRVSDGMTFLMLLNMLFQSYPEIERKYPPGKLGLLLNGKPPTTLMPLKDGDVLDLTAISQT